MNHVHREHLAELAHTLAAERELLELLLFKLVEARLVLSADEPRFVPQAMREVENVVERLRFSELHRGATVARLATMLGESPDTVTLRFLAGRAPEPYRTMFEQHHDHFQRLTAEIEQVTLDNRRLASLAVQNLTDTLGAMLGAPTFATYTATGTSASPIGMRPSRIDEAL